MVVHTCLSALALVLALASPPFAAASLRISAHLAYAKPLLNRLKPRNSGPRVTAVKARPSIVVHPGANAPLHTRTSSRIREGLMLRGGSRNLANLKTSALPIPIPAAIQAFTPTALTYSAACLLPTCLGFWRSEYTVSFGYGLAMLFAAIQVLPSATTALAQAHAVAIALYGARLSLFLLFRELFIPRFRDFRNKIEQRAKNKGGRLKRLPFVLGCSVLYGCMAAPVLLTATAGLAGKFALGTVIAMYTGLGIAAWGDFTKTWVKADKGEAHLVTSGPFAILRHPNYTGEILLWTANVLAAFATGGLLDSWQRGGLFGASLTGLLGIVFVLMQAATGLEKKQMERYGSSEKYQKWIKHTWAGPVFPRKDASPSAAPPEGTATETPAPEAK